MKKFLIIVVGGLTALVLVMVARTALIGGGSETAVTRASFTVYDGDAIAARLGCQQALRRRPMREPLPRLRNS